MSYTQVICMKCSCQYIQETDPWGNYYPINIYMCGHCGAREIYKKELTDEQAKYISVSKNGPFKSDLYRY